MTCRCNFSFFTPSFFDLPLLTYSYRFAFIFSVFTCCLLLVQNLLFSGQALKETTGKKSGKVETTANVTSRAHVRLYTGSTQPCHASDSPAPESQSFAQCTVCKNCLEEAMRVPQ